MAEHRFTTNEGHRFIIRIQKNGLVQLWRDYSSEDKKNESLMTRGKRKTVFANLKLGLLMGGATEIRVNP